MKIHITFTGFLAGKVVCGEKKNENDKYFHLGNWIDNPKLKNKICKKCLKLYNEVENENSN
jgi:hypothetical protein